MRSLLSISLLCLAACSPASESGLDDGAADTADTGGADTDPDDTGSADGSCQPNHDWLLSFEELPADPALGIEAIYTSNAPGSLVSIPDIDGVLKNDGFHSWDFTLADGVQDQQWTVTIRDLEGTWFQEHFPDATYYVGLDASEQEYGVYRVDAEQERLFLLGLVSAEPDLTLLTYLEPVVVFEFPMVLDKQWSSDAVQAEGVYQGQEYPADYGVAGVVSLEHSYQMQVDRQGYADVPLGEFEVLRLRVDQQLSAINSYTGPFSTSSMISYFFLAECAGLAARVRGPENGKDPSFQQASEYLRLGF